MKSRLPKRHKTDIESKDSFIHISSIASLSRFWLPGYGNNALFLDSFVLEVLAFVKIHPVPNYFPKTYNVLFSNVLLDCSLLGCSWQISENKIGSHIDWLRKQRAFVSLSPLILRKSLTFCSRTRLCAGANAVKLVRSRNAQCNPKKSLLTWCFVPYVVLIMWLS